MECDRTYNFSAQRTSSAFRFWMLQIVHFKKWDYYVAKSLRQQKSQNKNDWLEFSGSIQCSCDDCVISCLRSSSSNVCCLLCCGGVNLLLLHFSETRMMNCDGHFLWGPMLPWKWVYIWLLIKLYQKQLFECRWVLCVWVNGCGRCMP